MSSRVPSQLSVMVVCIVLLGAATAAQDEVNLVKNPGFENGLEGWGKPTVQLIEGAKAAHSGTKCVAGEVKEKNQSRVIGQEIDLDANRVYRVSFWLKSPQRARSIVHLLSTDKKQMEVMEIRRSQRAWRKYETLLSPRTTGRHTLRFAIPSSFGQYGKAGQVFLDDVELVALPQAAAPMDLSKNDGFSDWPDMAADASGALWAAWTSYADGADRLKGCAIRNGEARDFDVPVTCDGRILWPRVIGDRDGAWLLWSMEANRNWDIYATRLSGDGPSQIVRITGDPSVETKPCGAVDKDGRLWIAWEGNKDGGRDIYCTALTGGKIGETTRLTDNPTSDQNPALCATESGDVIAAWDSFRDSNYDIYLRRNAAGQWGPEVRLTDQPLVDRRPYLAAFGNDAWIAWDNTIIPGYHMSSRTDKRIRLGKLAGDNVLAPKGINDTMLARYSELATLAMDKDGRLWVALKRARGQRGDWDTWVLSYSGGQWSGPVLASGGLDGVTRRAPMAFANGKLHLVWQSDDRPNRPERIGYTGEQHSNIYYGTLDPSATGPPAAPLDLVEYTTEEQPNALKEYRTRFNEDMPERLAIEYNGEKLSVYWGLFHEHTELSQCNARGDGSPDTNFAEARDIARLDFCALTDHGQDMIPYDWHHLQKITSVNHDPARFITYLAEEWAGARKNLRDESRKAGGYGHRNIIFADERYPRHFDPIDNTPPDELWKTLKGVNQITIPHQLADGTSRTDWSYVDEANQPVAEIFQNRGSYEYFGAPRQASIFTEGFSIQDQWAKGTIIGVIASPDHGGGNGKAAVFAKDLTRESILDACRKRRSYGTTAAKIFMDVRVNGHLMGEAIQAAAGAPVTVAVKIAATGKIKQVEVAKDNRFVHTVSPEGKTAEFTFEDTQPRGKRSFYYVRVIQDDDEIAWSSPVWVE